MINHLTEHRRSAEARSAAGFTLIEVMITVAIVAILAAVALPSYNDYLRRGKMPEAFSQLSDLRSKMEQYYQDYRSYGDATKCAKNMASGTWGDFASTANFTYECTTSSPFDTYTITAKGKGSLDGYWYTINQQGTPGTSKFKNTTVSTSTCWMTKSASC